MTGTIDVMLPYFGDSPHFRQAVESVRAQTFTDWRLVCVEDASPRGDAGPWLAELGDDRIVHLRNDRNLGVAGNFALCLTLVEADHFVMMGSDDLMLANHLAVLDDARRRHPEADLIQTRVEVIDDAGRVARPLPDVVKAVLRPRTRRGDRELSGESFASSLTRADWAYFPSLLWRTDRARRLGFDQRYAIALDLGLILDIALDGGRMVVLDPLTFRYRRHRASASMAAARTGERFEQERAFFLAYATRFAEHGWRRAARIARWHVVSRLNAASEVPGALLHARAGGVPRLIAHVFG
ncbi:glycosyltransferase family 2 protein [Microbacterium flavum]|uniref:Glycosyltransferase n=1 Tax=Microbacterium flavum TaxID=415216 RepID=A0ABS5XUX8_9MICO|nr:glycosyltransferase [Microbacterium flavum]MBT8798226.1 glycosyltransferase [Microbacterium flavum]